MSGQGCWWQDVVEAPLTKGLCAGDGDGSGSGPVAHLFTFLLMAGGLMGGTHSGPILRHIMFVILDRSETVAPVGDFLDVGKVMFMDDYISETGDLGRIPPS